MFNKNGQEVKLKDGCSLAFKEVNKDGVMVVLPTQHTPFLEGYYWAKGNFNKARVVLKNRGREVEYGHPTILLISESMAAMVGMEIEKRDDGRPNQFIRGDDTIVVVLQKIK